MRIRSVTLLFLTLASTACVGLDGKSAQVKPESGKAAPVFLPPTATQSPVPWPAKPVPNQVEGKVPDYSQQNAACLKCHDDILEVKTPRPPPHGPDVPNLHVLHLESKKIAYDGKNRACVTCHEMMTLATDRQKKEGWFLERNVYHPNVTREPAGVWKKLIVRPDPNQRMKYIRVETLLQISPHPYKPTLKRLVCVDCHGPDSKIRTFYGAPQLYGTAETGK